MAGRQLVEWIREASLRGLDNEKIMKTLLAEGYRKAEIEEAIKQLQSTGEMAKPKRRARKLVIAFVLLLAVVVVLFYVYQQYSAYRRITDILGTTIEIPDAWCDPQDPKTAVIPVSNLGSAPLNTSYLTITRKNDGTVIPWNTIIQPKSDGRFKDTQCTKGGEFKLCEYRITLGDRVVVESIKVQCSGW